MTTGEKYLIAIVESKYKRESPGELMGILMRMGVVDRTLCQTLVIREFVAQRVKDGSKKIDAMREAADKFGCSLASVKKYEYYNTNVNLIN